MPYLGFRARWFRGLVGAIVTHTPYLGFRARVV